MDIQSGQVIEMIAIQAASLYSIGNGVRWKDMDVKERPVFEETWFWDNFNDMVDEAIMNLLGAVEGWVTVEYEQEVQDIIDAV